MSKTFISTDQELRKGDSLVSQNGEYTAIFQTDNNFVIYKKNSGPTWATGTNDKNPFRILLQADGNLVMYRQDDHPVWNTSTNGSGSSRMRLTLSDEGHLVLDSNGVTTWTSQNSRGT